MGVRFRKSVKIAPGVKVSVGKKSASVSVGGKAGRYTVSTSGRRTASTSIPGTGVSFVETSGKSKKKKGAEKQHETCAGLSSRANKIYGVILIVLAALSLLMGFAAFSVSTGVGVAMLVLCVLCFVSGVRLIRKTKNL